MDCVACLRQRRDEAELRLGGTQAELGYQELGYQELGYQELGYQELGYQLLIGFRCPPRGQGNSGRWTADLMERPGARGANERFGVV